MFWGQTSFTARPRGKEVYLKLSRVCTVPPTGAPFPLPFSVFLFSFHVLSSVLMTYPLFWLFPVSLIFACCATIWRHFLSLPLLFSFYSLAPKWGRVLHSFIFFSQLSSPHFLQVFGIFYNFSRKHFSVFWSLDSASSYPIQPPEKDSSSLFPSSSSSLGRFFFVDIHVYNFSIFTISGSACVWLISDGPVQGGALPGRDQPGRTGNRCEWRGHWQVRTRPRHAALPALMPHLAPTPFFLSWFLSFVQLGLAFYLFIATISCGASC